MATLLSGSAPKFKDRFVAWWNGEEFADGDAATAAAEKEAAAAAGAAVEEEDIPPPTDKRAWTAERIHTVQMVMGEGCHAPDVAGRTAELIAPAGLNSSMTVLEVGSGLGLGARTIARQTGAYVDAIERNPMLLRAARAMQSDTPEDKKVTFLNAPLDEPEIMKLRRDLILSRDSLHRQEDPKTMLKQFRALMKPSAQLIVTDFVLPENGNMKDLKQWLDLHDEEISLCKTKQLRQALTGLGLEVHFARDESPQFVQQTLQAIQEFAQRLEDKPATPAWREWVMVEVEYWARLVSLLEQEKIHHVRISASVHG